MPSNTRSSKSKARPVPKRKIEKLGVNKTPRNSATRTSSKQAAVIALLSQPKGATVTAIMKLTGWKRHSVRGFFAAIVRKKLELELRSHKDNGERVYHIVTNKSAKTDVSGASSQAA